MSTTLILFYGIFLSQIFLISVYFPMKIRSRILYILNNFPPKDYPKLYPKPYDYSAEQGRKNGLNTYRFINLFIAGVGLAILGWGLVSGYDPDPLGGDEIFVMMYFVLQISPILYLEIKGLKIHQRMRKANIGSPRKAELNPRHLFDFISPVFVALAVLLYAGWMAHFIYNLGFDAPWRWEVYLTLAGITGMNLLFAGIAAKFMLGKKINPHQAYKDRLNNIETVVKTSVFASIAASVFLIMTDLADTYAWELYDPIMMSVYVQVILSLSLGIEIKKIKVEAIDFEVYKKDKPARPV
ncbi:MAG: hypothetical protein V3R64_10095 [Sphingomonadales bacterium]